MLGVDHLIFYAARYFFYCSSPVGFFKAVLDIFVLLKNSARYFFFNQKHMFDIFWGICTSPLSKNKWSILISKYQFNSKILRMHFSSLKAWNNREVITKLHFKKTFSLSSTSSFLQLHNKCNSCNTWQRKKNKQTRQKHHGSRIYPRNNKS